MCCIVKKECQQNRIIHTWLRLHHHEFEVVKLSEVLLSQTFSRDNCTLFALFSTEAAAAALKRM